MPHRSGYVKARSRRKAPQKANPIARKRANKRAGLRTPRRGRLTRIK